MNLFNPVVAAEKQHPIFRMALGENNAPERAVIDGWAADFPDRDGKFVQEFQSTFESSFWELYVNASLRALGIDRDFSFARPDFVAKKGDVKFCLEATIATPEAGGKPAYGDLSKDIPEDFNEFNQRASLRIANSFSAKVKKYREEYARLPQCSDAAYVIGISSFDRPFSHFAASRPILSVLYGLYFDEEATRAEGASKVIRYHVSGVRKNERADVEMAYFCNEAHRDVSAVVYSSLATWGKARALADNPAGKSMFVTFHPNDHGIEALKRITPKAEYREDLLDGLHVFHNPYAERPLPREVFAHPRVAQVFVHGDELEVVAPDDMLLVRFLFTVNTERQAVELAQMFAPKA